MKKYPDKVFKLLVRTWDGNLVSVSHVWGKEKAVLTYIPGRITRPTIPTSRLFCFLNLFEAQWFYFHNTRGAQLEIWSATAYGTKMELPPLDWACLDRLNGIKWIEVQKKLTKYNFWSTSVKDKHFSRMWGSDSYATFAALKLEKKVWTS